jgi:hypothetical protein
VENFLVRESVGEDGDSGAPRAAGGAI